MTNFTDSEMEALRLVYEESKKWGKQLGELIENGDVDPSKLIKLSLPIKTEIDPSSFSLSTRLILGMGSEKAGMLTNGGIAAAGCYTGGNSVIQYGQTQNLIAKRSYLLSVGFSVSAIVNCGVAVLSHACQVSEVGVFSEALGAGFMWWGNGWHAAALQAEGKPIPPELRRYLRKNHFNDKIAFSIFQCLELVIILFPVILLRAFLLKK